MLEKDKFNSRREFPCTKTLKANINIIGSNLPHVNSIAGVYLALFEALAVESRPYNS